VTPHIERAGLGVELDRDLAGRVECARVGSGERALDRVQHLFEGDADFGAKRAQRFGQAFG
jgi:hypothetical protein